MFAIDHVTRDERYYSYYTDNRYVIVRARRRSYLVLETREAADPQDLSPAAHVVRQRFYRVRLLLHPVEHLDLLRGRGAPAEHVR